MCNHNFLQFTFLRPEHYNTSKNFLLLLKIVQKLNMSHCMGIPTICIGENKGTDQLHSNCEADQRLCFHYTGSTIPLFSKSKISSHCPSSVTVEAGLCRTWSKPKSLVFTGSYILKRHCQTSHWKRTTDFEMDMMTMMLSKRI